MGQVVRFRLFRMLTWALAFVLALLLTGFMAIYFAVYMRDRQRVRDVASFTDYYAEAYVKIERERRSLGNWPQVRVVRTSDGWILVPKDMQHSTGPRQVPLGYYVGNEQIFILYHIGVNPLEEVSLESIEDWLNSEEDDKLIPFLYDPTNGVTSVGFRFRQFPK